MPKAKQIVKNVSIPKRMKKKIVSAVQKEESKDTKSLARSIARTLGTIGGGMLGGPLGSKLGGDAAEWVTKVTGFGDYQVEGNSLLKEQVPQFMSSNDGIVITHKEYITDIFGSQAFVNQGGQNSSTVPWSGLINPGNSILFPWLSTIGQSFEMYQFEGLIFEFKSTSSNALNSTNTALGVVIMTTNYDVLDKNFSTKQQAEAYEFTCSTSPAVSIIHPVECKPGRNVLDKYYVTGIESADVLNGDPRIYYQGNFQIMTQGMQATADIGELWVSYKVKLIRPKLPTPLNSNLPYTHIVSTSNTSGAWGTPTYKSGSTLTVNMIPITGVLYFPAVGRYLCIVIGCPATTLTRTATWINNGSASFPNVFTDISGNQDNASLNSASSTWASATVPTVLASACFDINSINSDSIVLPTYTTTAGLTFYDILIFPISSGFTSRNPFGEFIKQLVQRETNEFERRFMNERLSLSPNHDFALVDTNHSSKDELTASTRVFSANTLNQPFLNIRDNPKLSPYLQRS